mmetsp:Transcript_5409/g.16759  ORF Transcript_5409/g.16759 Transcript_5409/m.16759 type:complete len:169 (+) Transcript_5409:1046-1552(+)
MATSEGGLRIPNIPTKATEAIGEAIQAEVAAAPPPADPADDTGAGRVRTERIENVMGSQAGAGSSDFHIYRRHRRTEANRLDRMDREWEAQTADEEHAARVDAKKRECEERTAKNAAKRRKKKEAKAKRDAIHKGTGGAGPAFEDDGSFLERAKAMAAKAKAGDESKP